MCQYARVGRRPLEGTAAEHEFPEPPAVRGFFPDPCLECAEPKRVAIWMLLYAEKTQFDFSSNAAIGSVNRLYDPLQVTTPTLCDHYM